MSAADPNRVILTGENPFIRLSDKDGSANTTNASFWRIVTCPAARLSANRPVTGRRLCGSDGTTQRRHGKAR